MLNRHGNREPLKIDDEYDVQDLLQSILRLFFDDVRAEDCVPSYAGGNLLSNPYGLINDLEKQSSDKLTVKVYISPL